MSIPRLSFRFVWETTAGWRYGRTYIEPRPGQTFGRPWEMGRDIPSKSRRHWRYVRSITGLFLIFGWLCCSHHQEICHILLDLLLHVAQNPSANTSPATPQSPSPHAYQSPRPQHPVSSNTGQFHGQQSAAPRLANTLKPDTLLRLKIHLREHEHTARVREDPGEDALMGIGDVDIAGMGGMEGTIRFKFGPERDWAVMERGTTTGDTFELVYVPEMGCSLSGQVDSIYRDRRRLGPYTTLVVFSPSTKLLKLAKSGCSALVQKTRFFDFCRSTRHLET